MIWCNIDLATLHTRQVKGNSCKGVRVVQGWDGSSIFIRSGCKTLRFISWFTGKVHLTLAACLVTAAVSARSCTCSVTRR